MCLQDIPLAGGAVPLPPGAAVGMAIGLEIAVADPAILGTVPRGAKLDRGIDLARTPPRGGDHWRRWRCLLGCLCTGDTRGLDRQARKRRGSTGALSA